MIFSAANLPADCINLGQGYMNFAPPQWVKDAADEALSTVAANHYSHPKGRVRLREAIKKHFSPLLERDLDIESEILVTSGANEGKHMNAMLDDLPENCNRAIFCFYCILGRGR